MLFQREFKTIYESERWDEIIKLHTKPGSVKLGNNSLCRKEYICISSRLTPLS